MNLYATLSDAKTRLGLTGTTHDALLLALLEMASRQIDVHCGRHFNVESATRYFNTGPESGALLIDDVLSISAFTTDSESDGSFDGETWTEGDANDFVLWPFNGFPKMQVWVAPDGSYAFAKDAQKNVKITGLWGYGDRKSATPYEAAGVTVTADDAAETELDVSAEGTIQAGHTLLVELEQIYVSAATSDDTKKLTVERGVNGTTAAAHDAKAASIYRYPKIVEYAALVIASEAFQMRGQEFLANERIGDRSFGVLTNPGKPMIDVVTARLLADYRRIVA